MSAPAFANQVYLWQRCSKWWGVLGCSKSNYYYWTSILIVFTNKLEPKVKHQLGTESRASVILVSTTELLCIKCLPKWHKSTLPANGCCPDIILSSFNIDAVQFWELTGNEYLSPCCASIQQGHTIQAWSSHMSTFIFVNNIITSWKMSVRLRVPCLELAVAQRLPKEP